jgi:(S)-ureidoglycine-glyoxylate aminotransferase
MRDGPLDVPRRLLMGSGPSNPEPRVLQALARPPIPTDHPAFVDLVNDLEARIKAVFRTESRGFAVPGASRSGLEAAIASLVAPGERVMVGVYGHFGELLCTLAARHGAIVERVEAEWGQPVDAERFANTIRKNPPKLAAIVHADTSTGILQPLERIGEACRQTGTLLLVDVVLSIGGTDVSTDAFCIDVAVGGLQKCLGGPPGLALLALSSTAKRKLQERPGSMYLDLNRLLQSHSEHPTPMLFAAYEALGMVLEEGLEQRWQRHRWASTVLRAGIDAMELTRFGNEQHSVPMITLVNVPEGIDDGEVRAQLLQDHGIEIMAAFGALRGRVLRIGTMGTNACLPSVLAVLAGLEAVLASRGLKLRRGAGVDAAVEASRRRL